MTVDNMDYGIEATVRFLQAETAKLKAIGEDNHPVCAGCGERLALTHTGLYLCEDNHINLLDTDGFIYAFRGIQ